MTTPAAGQPDTRPHRPRLLFLAHRLPFPPDRGDRIRSFHLLQLLTQHFTVDLACTSDEPVHPEHRAALQALTQRLAVQRIHRLSSRIRGATALAGGMAITPAMFFRRRLARTIEGWQRETPYDALLTFCTGMAMYSRLITGTPDAPNRDFRGRHVLDLVDVDSIKWQNYASMTNPPVKLAYAAEAWRLREVEAGVLDRFDAVTVISDAEAEAYRGNVGASDKLHVVPNGVDLNYFQPLPDVTEQAGVHPHTLAFVGVLNYRPNVEGLRWFVRSVWPGLRHRLPDARLLVVGKHPGRAARALAETPGVELVGPVPDVRDPLRQAAAVIAPLRLAMGVQNKVLEAMASARAVVCSPGAARGIAASDGEHLCVADDPDQWVDTLVHVLTHTDARRALAAAARTQVQSRYAWDHCLAPMLTLLRGDQAAKT